MSTTNANTFALGIDATIDGEDVTFVVHNQPPEFAYEIARMMIDGNTQDGIRVTALRGFVAKARLAKKAAAPMETVH